MGAVPDGWWRDRPAARRRLVALLAGYARRTGDEVAVVFDGRPDPSELAEAEAAGLPVEFAPGGPDAADRVIAGRAAAEADPGGLTVVTSDRALAAQVRAAGVAVIGSGAFRRRL